MPTSLRFVGNRDLAAHYRGEANRLLFNLKQVLGPTPSGGMNRTYPDGTTICIRKFFDNQIVLISSPFVSGGGKRAEEKIYILAYRNSTISKIYVFRLSSPYTVKESTETIKSLHLKMKEITSGTAVGIQSLTKPGDIYLLRDDHVVSANLSYENWLRTLGVYYMINQVITYEFRYMYCEPGDLTWSTYQIPFRMVNCFCLPGVTVGLYYSQYAHSPSAAGWALLDHSTYATAQDVIGKANFTLPREGVIGSWKERISVQGNAPYSFFMSGTDNHPWTAPNYLINWFSRYSWPILGTVNARKVPQIYKRQYETESGTHVDLNFWTETLDYNDITTTIDLYNFTRIGSGSGLTYWPVAAIGNRDFLYFKNSVSQSSSETVTGDGTTSQNTEDDYSESITQEFYAGDLLLETCPSSITRNLSKVSTYTELTMDSVLNDVLNADLNWVEVLEYSNHGNNLIVFYKKIQEIIDSTYNYNEWGTRFDVGGQNQTDSRDISSTRQVQYWMAVVIDGVLTKRQLCVFTATLSASRSMERYYNYPGPPRGWIILSQTAQSQTTGSGERIYGISAQMNPDYLAYSFNREDFLGSGNSSDYYKTFARYYTGFWNWYFPLSFGKSMSMNEEPLPYPFPLEDMNYLMDGSTPAWSGNFVVGAIKVKDITGGTLPVSEFEFTNQTDFVAATGIVTTRIEMDEL